MHKGEHIQHFCLSQQFCCPPHSQADVDADVLLSGRGFAYVNMRMPELFPSRLSVHVCVWVCSCMCVPYQQQPSPRKFRRLTKFY